MPPLFDIVETRNDRNEGRDSETGRTIRPRGISSGPRASRLIIVAAHRSLSDRQSYRRPDLVKIFLYHVRIYDVVTISK